jgi:peptidoglycan/xylan/chitin deacetylase (PgdA/CDA1 family)
MKTEAQFSTELAGGPNFHRAFIDHMKCPQVFAELVDCSGTDAVEGFFRLGDLRLYGRINGGQVRPSYASDLPRVDDLVVRKGGTIRLPFNPTEIIENLRLERYVDAVSGETTHVADNKSLVRKIYYSLRPLFPVPFRRILQRIALRNWSTIPFPAWPVDTTVENFMNWLFSLILEASGEKEIPFIWYWPRNHMSCAIMTHDVETGEGQDFCPTMLEMEREYGIRSAFELVPEVRYVVSEAILGAIRDAGSEVCIHGLNHDGRLFSSEELFRSRAEAINQYALKWKAKGFRSPIMYRNQNWYDAFKFSYDMSVPNVAHLDPQRGGCCSVFPYFIGNILELPLTTIQDYALYNIVGSDPMEMWTRQMDAILSKHGLVSFIIHPDYTTEREKQALYRRLLGLLRKQSDERDVWLALPGEVDQWWRERGAMSLVQQNGKWAILGKGSERAALAYARLEDGALTYVLPNGSSEKV